MKKPVNMGVEIFCCCFLNTACLRARFGLARLWLARCGLVLAPGNDLPGDCDRIVFFYKKKGLMAFLKNKTLAMTYFRMGRPHTIIGVRMFHF